MPQLVLSLLGPFAATLDEQPVTTFESVKVRALLAFLALEADHPHSRAALAELLWPELPNDTARTYLRHALGKLKEAIADYTAEPPYLLATRDTVQFNPASDHVLDVASFTSLLAACDAHPHRHAETCRSCAQRREAAVAHYRGDFLAQLLVRDSADFEAWAALKREQLRNSFLDAMAKLAAYYVRRGDDGVAQQFLVRQVELEPWEEAARRQLMTILWRRGKRSAALAQYIQLRRILSEDLGVEPEAASTALFTHIRDSGERPVEDDEGAKARTSLPAPTTTFVGRAVELAQLTDLLQNPACRLVTLTGTGGIGKTRLALAAAAEQAWTFADGAAFVPMAAVNSAAFLAPAIMAALEVPLQDQRDPHEQLLSHLRGKEVLLVLDNVEHLLTPYHSDNDAVAELLSAILVRAPGVTLLVTSRERLMLPGEWLFNLSGLSYPAGEPNADVAGYHAVRLFMERADQVRRQFVLAEAEARAVARICQLVEGLPLAIELAAATLPGRSVTTIAEAIERNVLTLASGLRAVPERHRSMWATFEHSWHLLSEAERQVFPRLAVFRGGFEADAAAEVAHASPALLASLLDKSLLRWDGVARYDLHELMRQYAGAKLEAAGEAEPLGRQHAEYYLALADMAAPHLFSVRQVEMLDHLTREHDNVRAALAWCQTGTGRCELALRICNALEYYWVFRGHAREGHSWITGLLAQEADEAAAEGHPIAARAALGVRAHALRTAGDLKEGMGDLVQARAFLTESVRLYRELEEPRSLALSLWSLAHLEWTQGASARATQLAEESLRLFQAAADLADVVWALWLLSNIVREAGDLERASTLGERARRHAEELKLPVNLAYAQLSISRVRFATGELEAAHATAEAALTLGQRAEHPTLIAHVLLQQGRIAQVEGDRRRAAELWEQALSMARGGNHLRAVAEILVELGWAEHEQGNEERARALLTESLRLYRERGHPIFIAECLVGLAGVSVAGQQTPAAAYRAVTLYGATDLLQAAANTMLRPGARGAYVRDMAAARARVDDRTFATAWAEGQAMTLEQAVAYALEGT